MYSQIRCLLEQIADRAERKCAENNNLTVIIIELNVQMRYILDFILFPVEFMFIGEFVCFADEEDAKIYCY